MDLPLEQPQKVGLLAGNACDKAADQYEHPKFVFLDEWLRSATAELHAQPGHAQVSQLTSWCPLKCTKCQRGP